MLDPNILPQSKGTDNSRRKSFFDFLEPSSRSKKPRSNSMGVIEAPRHFNSQRFSYQSPSYESPSYPSTPFARQRTKCFDYPTFSSGNKFDSPIMIVTGGSPSVLDYGRMINKFSEGVNKKYGCRAKVALTLLSLTAIFGASMFYYSGSQLFENRFFLPFGIFQKSSAKAIFDSPTKVKLVFPDHHAYNLNGRGFVQPTVVNTIVGQLRVSTGISQINKVAKEKIIFNSEFTENSKISNPNIRETNRKENEFKIKERKAGKSNEIKLLNPEGLLGKKLIFEGRRDMNPDGRRDMNPDGRRDMNPDGRRDMNPDGRRDMNPDGRRDIVMFESHSPSRELFHNNGKTLPSEHDNVLGKAPIPIHEHGYASFMKDNVWAENRFTIPTNKRKEDIWRNEGNYNYQPQPSYRHPSGFHPPPGINPRIYERGFDF